MLKAQFPKLFFFFATRGKRKNRKICRVAINGHLGGEGPPPDLEIKVGRFGKKLAGLGKKLAVWKKVGRFRKKSCQVREKVGRSAEKVGRLGKKLAGC